MSKFDVTRLQATTSGTLGWALHVIATEMTLTLYRCDDPP